MKKILSILLASLLSLCLLSVATAETYEPDAWRQDATMADFEGEWLLSGAYASGNYATAQSVGLEGSKAIISDGTVTLILLMDGEDAGQSNSTGEIRNGELLVVEEDGVVHFGLYEDGSMGMQTEGADNDEVIILFARQMQDADIIGVWYLYSITKDGEEIFADDPGLGLTITLEEDGTVYLTSDDEDGSWGSWSRDGSTLTIVSDEDVEDVFTIRWDGALILESEGSTMVFLSQSPEKNQQPVAREDVVLADFNGRWEVTGAYQDGEYRSAEEMDAGGFQAAIADGIITLIEPGDSQPVVVEGALEGNALTMTEDERTYRFYLYEDGTLGMTMATEEEADAYMTQYIVVFSRAQS